MAYISIHPKIILPSLYTGSSTARTLTGIGFEPNLVWIKDRSNASRNHMIFDSLGEQPNTFTVTTQMQEATLADSLTAFTSDGFFRNR